MARRNRWWRASEIEFAVQHDAHRSYFADGKLVFYIATTAVKETINLTAVPIGGGPAVFRRAMHPGIPQRNVPEWSPDGLGIDYPVMQGGVGNLWRQPINGGEPKQLTKFTSLRLASGVWSAECEDAVYNPGIGVK